MSFCDPTIQLLSPLIQKPPLTSKYLERPPFRYIHDICTSLMQSTGYGQGLWAQDQLKSDNVKEKEQKMDFLQRMINITGIAVGHPIDVSPAKIVAGLEPEKTNILLQEMGKAGTAVRNGQLNMNDLLQRLSRGEKPGAGPPPQQQRPPQQQPPPQQQRPPQQQPPPQQQQPPPQQRPPQQMAPQSQMRGATPSQSQQGRALPPAVPGEDFIAATQRTLGTLIQKPPMTTKLLQKPPLKFILDCVVAVQQTTGFGSDYWQPSELDPNSLTDPKSKISFLTRLIRLVSVATGDSSLESLVIPKKIAAGLEPENTNLLLTRLAEAAASGISSQEISNRLNGSSNGTSSHQSQAQLQQEEQQPEPFIKKQEEVKSVPKLGLNELTHTQKTEDPDHDENMNPNACGIEQNTEIMKQQNTNTSRPKTARRAPPKQKSHLVEEKTMEQGPSGGSGKIEVEPQGKSATSTVITENEKVEDEPEEEPEDTLAEPLQGFEPTPSSDQAGALVRKILDATKDKAVEEKDKGGIKFGKIGATVNKSLFSQQQIDDLRAQIQKLCQSANPLGKCIDFVYEDMETMNQELQRWRKAYQGYTTKLEEEKRATDDMLAPLQQQLSNAELAVQEQHRKIAALKATILRNDQTIATLIEQKATIQ